MTINAISRPQASASRAPTAVEPVARVAKAAKSSHQPVAAELPQTPTPLTPATAAVHLMNVPSSRVLEAVVSVQRAMGLQTPREAPAASRAGTVIDVSA
jgi:hypothetical protein